MTLRTTLGIIVLTTVLAPAGVAQAQQSVDSAGARKPAAVKQAPEDAAPREGHHEIPRDPYIEAPRKEQPRGRSALVTRNGYVSVQVNVDGDGLNIIGDAANEPSIAVDPTDPLRMAIGWRQFDSIASDFRQAGYGYTTDGGATWTFPGAIDPGVFRSDPVLDADADGNFYYNSLTVDAYPNYNDFWCDVYTSTDGGATWSAGVFAQGGDKQWQTVDQTDGVGRGNIYAAWNQSFSICSGHFTRSTDGGQSFEDCSSSPGNPYWGTLAVGPNGEVYLSGVGFYLNKSVTAQDPNQSVTWAPSTYIDLGGSVVYSAGPNPGGLCGQAWVAADQSSGASRGTVYLLCSVDPSGPDPCDVMFARSTDGGQTFSAPIRVNDDTGTDAWQWFGTMSVAPNGRIDVIWLDTRADPGGYDSELYYSYSTDGGQTWSADVALSPPFDPHVGWPQQNKMGDYFDMVSDDLGADLAYAATFNGEQDVYYIRIGDPQCSDLGAVSFLSSEYGCESTATLTIRDCNANTDPGLVESLVVTVASGAEPAGESITLTEADLNSSIFEGSIDLSETNAVGVLQIVNGDTIVATYIDADDGEGGSGVIVTAEAIVDCDPPVISDVAVAEIGPHTAVISFTTDEPTVGTVRYGDACGALTESATELVAGTTHEITLTDLAFSQTYSFAVDAVDESGNSATDDNAGACYEFSTFTLIYEFTMDTDPEWSTQGQWAWGQPTGGGGSSGDPDPAGGYTDDNVYGYNLNGDYVSNMPEYHLTTPPLDCTDFTGVQLTFWRWLGVENDSWDHASLSVSTDGVSFDTLWENGGSSLSDGAWIHQEFDLSAFADGQPTVYLRWTMGTTDSSVQYCGWNIDDVRLSGLGEGAPCPWDTAPDGGDGTVGLGDLNALLSNWGPCPSPCPWDFSPEGGDGTVGLGDLNALLSNWGPCP
jgi:hypothetical protein